MNSTIAPFDDVIETPAQTDADAPESGEASAAPRTPRQLVKLTIDVTEAEFDRDIDDAFRKIGSEARLPGFRAGKVPRKVLEARIGKAAARAEALRDALPKYLSEAVRQHDVDLIATPEVEVTAGGDPEHDGPVQFEAVCEVRPVITVPGYGGLRVELPSPVATDAEIDEAVQAELRRQGSLVTVDRPAKAGDHVTLTLVTTRDGEPVTGLNTEDWLYEVGKGWVAEGFDTYLIGSSAGARLAFTANPSGTTEAADFDVTVSNVQEMQLPELTDEWVADNLGQFDTVEAWRADIAERLGNGKLSQARNQFIDRTTAALADLVEIAPPDSMLNGDLQARVQNTVQQFQAQGISIDQWLQITGQTVDAFVDALREQSMRAVKVDLALRAVAVAEALEVSDDDLEAEYARVAVQVRQKPSEVRKAYEKNDAVADLKAQLRKTKALDWLLEHVEVVDPQGAAIERDLLLDRHDHDHDHDHDHQH